MASIGQLEKQGKKLAENIGAEFDSYRSGRGGDEWNQNSHIEISLEGGPSFRCIANGYGASGKREFNNFSEMKSAIYEYLNGK